MIGISADFDPLHLGHVKLIEKGREIAEETGDDVAIYLNKGYSANHAPFFTSYEARRDMALATGADKVVPIEGLHHRLTLAYSVPIRIAMMIEDGVVDYVDAANVSTSKIIKYSEKFVKQGIFVGIPRDLPNRNVIRWFAVNEFLKGKYGRNMNFHIIKELQGEESEKISGRYIRKSIIDNDMIIPEDVKELLPKSTTRILQSEIKNNNLLIKRDISETTKKMNKYSRSALMKMAYLSGNCLNSIIENRFYYDEESLWATFRRAGYGPVLTRLAISSISEGVSREEVMVLMREYESKGVIPPEQNIDKVIGRAWYISNENKKGIHSSEAHEKFISSKIEFEPGEIPLSVEGGLNLTKSETRKLNKVLDNNEIASVNSDFNSLDISTDIFIDKNGKLACDIRTGKFKIKSPLMLPGQIATYLRFLFDSHFIPISADLIQQERGLRVKIKIHNH